MKYYDNTRIGAYKTCPRKYLIRHEFDLVRDTTALPLSFGLSWHDAMDAVWVLCSQRPELDTEEIVKAGMLNFRRCWAEKEGLPFELSLEQQEKFTPRTPMIAMEMLFNYVEKRRALIAECEILAVEQPFAVKVFEDDTPIRYIGRLDKVVKHPQHGVLVIEHKTSSSYATKTGLRSDYLASWSPNSQIDGYAHAAHMLYGDCKGVWVDAALVHKTVHNVFKFIPVDRTFAALDQWLHETRHWINRIEEERAVYESRPNASTYFGFPKNTESCNVYAGCTFRDLCKFNPQSRDILSNHEGFKVEKWEPFDILKIEKLGLPEETK